MTYADYVAQAAASPTRVEFVDGTTYAMAGGTPAHAQLAMQTGAALLGLLRSGRGRCRAYSADARIHVLATGNSFYPDAAVVCGPTETAPHDADAITNPTLLVEVLSDGTELFDRGRKFSNYQRIPTLRHYLLVAQDRVRVEHFRRNDDETWTLTILEVGGVVHLPDLGGDVSTMEIYRDVLPGVRAGE